jgi:hypothetical protein
MSAISPQEFFNLLAFMGREHARHAESIDHQNDFDGQVWRG